VKILVCGCRARKIDTWVKISRSLIQQTHIDQCHDLSSIFSPSIRARISDHVRKRPQLQASAAKISWVVPSKQTKCLKPLTPTGSLKEFGTGDPKCSWSINR